MTQKGQLPLPGASILRAAAAGISWTVMVRASTAPSFRIRRLRDRRPRRQRPFQRCSSAVCSWHRHLCRMVMVLNVTVIRLCPGCVCQPVVPPGTHTLDCTYKSDNPCVFCRDCQKTAGNVLL